MTMIEKVARALDPNLWAMMDDGQRMHIARRVSMAGARRAIEAMREPSDGMCRASKSRDDSPYDVWSLMIDAALNEDAK